MFGLEEELVSRHGIAAAIFADLHGDHFIAVRAEKCPLSFVPLHSRIAHIAIPGTFLGKDSIDIFIALLVHGIQPVQIGNAVYHHSVCVRKGLSDLTHPFPGHV